MSILSRLMLTNKNAIVTGGARGIGRACAVALAEMGADVAVIDKIDASETVLQIQELGRTAFYIHTDVSCEEEVNAAFEKICTVFEHIDIVFSNAGVAFCENCESMSYDDWSKVVSTNLDGAFLVTRAAGRKMIDAGQGGSIVLTASMSGIIVNYPQNQVAYNASKAGVIQLTKSLACEWACHNIRVNCISPGYTCTDMTPANSKKEWMDAWMARMPMKRVAMPEDIAGAVVYLAGDASPYTTGCNLVIDGGYSCY